MGSGLGRAASTGAGRAYKYVDVTKETRANVVFLTIFLAIALPGGVILFKKKLDPAVPPMYMPDRPRVSLPYNSPEEAPDLKRYVPERTGEWVTDVAREHGYADVRTGDDGLPVVLDQRQWQLIGVRPEGTGMRADFLVWEKVGADSGVGVSAVGKEGELEGRVEPAEPMAIPEPVRKELVYAGYPKPPKEATWVTVFFPGLTSQEARTMIRVRQKSDGGVVSDSVPFFTK